MTTPATWATQASPATVAADSVGVDPERLDLLLRRVRHEVRSGRLPSAQVAVARRGQLVAFETVGDAGAAADVPAYLLQSVGRTFVASAVWKLLGEGQVALTDRVADLVPGFGEHGKQDVTLEHVLTHRAGIPFAPLGYPRMADREQRLAAFARWRPDGPPGETFQFHLTSAGWLLAEVVERRTGLPLPQYLAREVAGPLGLGLALGVGPAEQQARVAPMVCTDGDGSEVDAWGPWYLNTPGVVAAGEPSHAVVGTAADVALHYQALLAALEGDDRVWAPEALAEAVRLRAVAVPAGAELYGGSPQPVGVGLFVLVAGELRTPDLPAAVSERAFGNPGASYQTGFADPETGLSFALLSNGYPASGYDLSRRGGALMTAVGALAADLV